MVARVRDRRWQDLEKDDIPLARLAQHFEVYNRSEGKSPRLWALLDARVQGSMLAVVPSVGWSLSNDVL